MMQTIVHVDDQPTPAGSDGRPLFETFVAIGPAGREALYLSFTRRLNFGAPNPWLPQSLIFLRGFVSASVASGSVTMETLINGLSFEAFNDALDNIHLDLATLDFLAQYGQGLVGFRKPGVPVALTKTMHEAATKSIGDWLKLLDHGGDAIAQAVRTNTVDWKGLAGSLYRKRAMILPQVRR